MDPTSPPKAPPTWGELLEWQRAWFEKGFRAAGPRIGGDRPLTPGAAYDLDVRIAVRRTAA